jgi:hypothetical protein
MIKTDIMKSLMKFGLLIVLTAGLTSCEEIKSIFDIEIDTTLTGTLDFDIEDSSLKAAKSIPFDKYKEIDPKNDEEIEEYLDKIVRFELNDVVVVVKSLSVEPVTLEAGTEFIIRDKSVTYSWELLTNWVINVGDELTLENVAEQYKKVAEMMDKKEKFEVGIDGTSPNSGVTIVLDMQLDTKVIANPL